jgi:membrane carboxypeptidase/penicillin-binding protein PbpC
MKSLLFSLGLLAALCFCSAIRAQDETKNLPLGGKLTMNVTADGTQPIAFKWFRDGTEIAEGPTLVVESLEAGHAGLYTVTASNAFGSAQSNKVTIAVGVPPSAPVITVALAPVTTVRNQTRNFTLRADASGGVAPLRWVWVWNGVPLPGQTSGEYKIAKVNPSFRGDYRATVIDKAGQEATTQTRLVVAQ